MSKDRLYIATQDPREGGGVATMSEFVYRCASDFGFDPCLVFNMLSSEDQIRLTSPSKLFRINKNRQIKQMKVDGMEAKGIPLIFPEIEFFQNVLNLGFWRQATSDGDSFFAVGGTNHVGLPFAFLGKSFGSWTATPLWEDRTDRLDNAPWIERLRDTISKPILLGLERLAFRRAEPTFLLSEYTRQVVSETHDMSASLFDVVPFPVDTTHFTPNGAVRALNETEGPVVLFVGRLNDPRKNVIDLIEAFKEVRRRIPDARLNLIGSKPSERIQNVVERNDIQDAVKFPGEIPNDELPKYYRNADLFVMPSAQEGLAIVGLEAMACGLPVVSTKCGGPEQYVNEDETGSLVEIGDQEALTERIVSILKDRELGREMGKRARALMVSDYAEKEIRTQFEESFENLTESSR